MEVISYSSLGEGDYEMVDYITINGFAVNTDLVRGVSFSKDQICLTMKVRHGVNTFLSLIQKLASEGEIFTVRVSNFHGGYLLASGVITFKDDPVYIVPDTIQIIFEARDVRMDTYSEFDETCYMTEVKQKD